MKAITFLLALAVAGLGSWAIWEFRERTRLANELAEIALERDALRRTAAMKVSVATGAEIQESGPKGLGVDLDSEEKNPVPEKKKLGDGNATAKTKSNPFKSMFTDPAMKDVMKAQIRAQSELMHRDLFDMLGLEGEKRDAVEKVLAERMTGGLDAAFASMDDKMSEEEQKKAAEAAAKAEEAATARLKEILGPEAYDQFDRYQKSAQERQQLQVLNSMLKEKGLSLDEATETRLMDAMYQERIKSDTGRDMGDPTKIKPGAFEPDNIATVIREIGAINDRVLERARTILTPEQLEVFRTSQQQQRQLMEMGIRMMGGGDDGAGERN